MGYLYSKRFTPDNVTNDPILTSLRQELYLQDYHTIQWIDYRQTCATIDEYIPLNPILKIIQDISVIYERILPYIPFLKYLREKGCKIAMNYIHTEDLQTNYIDIGPVNKALNMLAVWVDNGGNSKEECFLRHIARIDDYLWVAEDGMKMQGYNGSQCWDTAFALQAIIESGLGEEHQDCLTKAYDFFQRSQIKKDEENFDDSYRHISKGGWPFSTAAHGWPISDCTAEATKAVLGIHASERLKAFIPSDQLLSSERLYDACNIILS